MGYLKVVESQGGYGPINYDINEVEEQPPHYDSSSKIKLEDESSGREIDWAYGPLKLEGLLSMDTLEIEVAPSVDGTKFPLLYSNIKDGLKVNFNIDAGNGIVSLYLKNGNELWVHMGIEASATASSHQGRKFDSDVKIITF